MTWFKVDDGFYDHPKIETLSMAARGLWVTAATWCAKQLTDGVIPAAKVRKLGGTKAQIHALIKAGLWIEMRDDSGAKCYAFHDWLDQQPSRESILERRANDAQRKQEARNAKSDKQRKRKNVRMDVRTESAAPSAWPSEGESALPDPTRPDPTRSMGKESQPTYGDLGATEDGGGLTLDGLADATRRARQAGISESAIATGTRKFNARPNPKGPGLLRTLINDAWETEQTTHTNAEAKAQRRAAIDACTQCDDLGYVKVANGTVAKCTHQPMKGPF